MCQQSKSCGARKETVARASESLGSELVECGLAVVEPVLYVRSFFSSVGRAVSRVTRSCHHRLPSAVSVLQVFNEVPPGASVRYTPEVSPKYHRSICEVSPKYLRSIAESPPWHYQKGLRSRRCIRTGDTYPLGSEDTIFEKAVIVHL